MAITKLTAATRKEVESRSPKALPNRPGDKGWDGDQVRKYLYWAIMMVYDLLAEHIDEVAAVNFVIAIFYLLNRLVLQ